MKIQDEPSIVDDRSLSRILFLFLDGGGSSAVPCRLGGGQHTPNQIHSHSESKTGTKLKISR